MGPHTKQTLAAVVLLLGTLSASSASAEPPTGLARPPAPPGSYHPAAPRQVDPSTLHGKLIFGYQGWFSTADDGSPVREWNHWSVDRKRPNEANARVQMWPDLSEYDADELYDTDLKHPDGSVAKVYSAGNLKTVMRHFRWMRDYNLDGAMHYRFINRVSSRPEYRAFYDKVVDNIRRSAEAYGRVFAVQYDISDYQGPSVVRDIQSDWKSLVDGMRITSSPRYLQHRGRPLLVLRNFGNSGGRRLITPAEAAELIEWLKTNAPEKYRVTVMGALPGYWRTQGRDVKPDPGWPAVFRSFDVVSAWPVGRVRDAAGAEQWLAQVIIPDMAECARLGIDYMPAIYPGYSYHNADPAKPYNAIPRLGGRFYWRQVHNVVSANATMIYNAIFDEVDEGTAMYKVSPSAATQPVMPQHRRFLPLDADGEMLPSDWYLRLADYAGRALRKEIVPTPTRPIAP
ncbi:MAG: xylosidase/arabinosidase [Verrucomicrobia bacterium]|nr:xylosidase/arabinosidase [Verrucomicrobiota bacterium]